MAIAPKLQLKQGQSLVMTPQLQQAIKLLQLSNIELAAFVEEQLESNPLLERGTGDENRRGESTGEGVVVGDTSATESVSVETPAATAADMDVPAHAVDSEATVSEMAADVGGSVDWSKAGSGGTFNGSGDYDAAANTAAEKSLSEHFIQELPLLGLEQTDKLIAQHLIDHVDDNGYLRVAFTDMSCKRGVPHNQV